MKIKTGEFIAISASTMMLTALGIDIMLPVFGEIRKHFGLSSSSTATANIVVFFFLGQVTQIIFGILSDRFGRLTIQRIGFPLYIIGGIAATYAPNLGFMIVARFIAGMGASAVLTTTIAGVRDRFSGDEMAKILSLIFTIFLSTPVFAPFLGIAILSVASWRMVFLTPVLFAIIAFIWSLRLEESLPKSQRSVLSARNIFLSTKAVLSNRVFLRYTAITTILFAGLSAWVSSSEHIITEIYRKPYLFAWIFGGIGLLQAFFTLTNSRLSSKFGARPTLRYLLVVYTVIAACLLASDLVFGDPPKLPLFVAAVALLLGINLAVEPNSSALAMEPMGSMAGLASSLYGTSFFFIGAGLGSIISMYMKDSVSPIIFSFFTFGIITLILAFSDRRPLQS